MSFCLNISSKTLAPEGNYCFTKTPFYKAAKESLQRTHRAPNHAEVRLRPNQMQLVIPIPSLIVFSYATPSLEEYSRHYSSEGWVARKLAAVPDAFIGLCRLIYRMVSLVGDFFKATTALFFEEDPTLLEKNKTYQACSLFASSFNYVRDWEEFTGSLVTLVWDRGGSYLVEDSRFHKEMYACKMLAMRA